MAGIRMTGLISNMDTESIVTQLMEAQRTKVTKIQNKKTKLEWSQDKWKDLNTKLYKLYQEQTSNLRLVGNYSTKKATSADESVVKVTAGNSVPSGTHSIAITQLASTQYLTGDKLGSNVTTSSKLSSLGIMEGTVITIKGTKEIEYKVSSNDTLNNFISKCKEAGVNASYDTKQQRLFLSAAKSGKDNEFTITSNTSSALVSGVATDAATQKTAKEALSIMNLNKSALDGLTDEEKTAFYTKAKNLEYTDTDTATSLGFKNEQQFEYAKAYKTLYDLTATQAIDDASAQKAAETLVEESIRKTIYSNSTENDYGLTGIKTKTVIDAEIAAYKEGTLTDADVKSSLDKITTLAKQDIETANGGTPIVWDTASEELKKELADKVYGYYVDSIVETACKTGEGTDAIAKAKANQIKLAKDYAEKNMQSIISGYVNSGGAGFGSDALESLGISSITKETDGTINYKGKGTFIAAADCKAIYNGAEMTSTTNTLSVNGLTFEALSVSEKTGTGGNEYKKTTITVSNDTDAVYKKVKDFITQYNSILKDLNDAYYADSAKGYDPLTDEEKEAMTDDQIKMWEDKIKKSLLRRDSTLGGLTSTMKMAMSSYVELNGKKYSLSTFGIMTSTDYSEKGLLHIYGDTEDSTYSDKEDKLKAAIEADPDTFAEAFSGIVKNLHDTLYKKMAKTSLSSALTFYNDKSMKDQISTYEKNISTLENKLSDMENRYYKQFTAMETALAKLQSQQSALSGLLGTN